MNLIERLRLLAAWRKPGGPTPTERKPSTYATCIEAITEIERLTAQVERMREALGWYADTFCEYSTRNEGCGKFDDDVCAGCKARALSYRGGD